MDGVAAALIKDDSARGQSHPLLDAVHEVFRGGEIGRLAEGAHAVVQGHSPDTGWRLLAEATVALRAGAVWVACNLDPTLPTERGPLPGNGCPPRAT